MTNKPQKVTNGNSTERIQEFAVAPGEEEMVLVDVVLAGYVTPPARGPATLGTFGSSL